MKPPAFGAALLRGPLKPPPLRGPPLGRGPLGAPPGRPPLGGLERRAFEGGGGIGFPD